MSLPARPALLLLLVGLALGALFLRAAGDGGGNAPPPGAAGRAPPPSAARPTLEGARPPGAAGKPGPAPTDPSPRPSEAGPLPADPATPERPARLRVTVRGPAGPLPGARVGAGARETVTDAQGEALFDGLSGSAVTLRATAAGHLEAEPLEVDLAADAGTTAELVLEAGLAVEGVVVEAGSGAAVPGVLVQSAGGGSTASRSDSGGRESYGSAPADAEGRFRFPALPVDWIVTLYVEAEGYARGHVCVLLRPGEPPRPLRLSLEPGGSLAVLVRDAAGRPVPGARVEVGSVEESEERTPMDARAEAFPDARFAGAGTSDAEGRFLLRGVPFGLALRATARAPGWAPAEPRTLPPAMAAAPRVPVELVLRRPARVRLRPQAPHGRPLREVWVSAPGGVVTTPAEGLHVVDDLPPGPRRIELRATGYRPVELELDLAEGETVERSVPLDPGARLEGRVVDAAGAGVDGALVRAEAGRSEASGRSAPTGTFLIDGLAPGPHRVVVAHDDHETAVLEDVQAPGADLRVVLVRKAVVRFTLSVPPGVAAPEGVTVWRFTEHGSSGSSVPFTVGEVVQVRLGGEERGLEVTAEGFLPLRRELRLEPGEERDLGPLQLDPGATLTGRVLDEAGAPLPGAEVALVFGEEAAGAFSGPDGRFVLRPLPRDGVLVQATHPEAVSQRRRVDARADPPPLELRLPRGRGLRIVLRRADGTPVEGHLLTVRPTTPAEGDLPEHEALTDARGMALLRLRPGRYRVEVQGAGALPLSQEVEVGEALETLVTLRLP